MDGIGIVVTASAGLDIFILGAVILNAYRVGKIEGGLKNGAYISCPFYGKKVQNSVNKGDCKVSGKDS